MMMFGDPDEALPNGIDAHVSLTPHRPTHDSFKGLMSQVGEFNAGYIAFRNSESGLDALRWWKDRCLESCSVDIDNGIFADQKYLDELSTIFEYVHVCQHKGVNAAPWNISNTSVYQKDGRVYIDNEELLVYHMQGFKKIASGIYDFYSGNVKLSDDV